MLARNKTCKYAVCRPESIARLKWVQRMYEFVGFLTFIIIIVISSKRLQFGWLLHALSIVMMTCASTIK